METDNKDILIGIPTIDRDVNSLQSLLTVISTFDKDCLVICRKSDEKVQQLLSSSFPKVKCETVEHYEIEGKRHNIERIADKRNIIKKYAMDNKYEKLVFIDSDMMPTKDQFQKLTKCCDEEHPLVAGAYKLVWTKPLYGDMVPILYKDDKVYKLEELEKDKVHNDVELTKVALVGLGFSSLHNSILNYELSYRHLAANGMFCEGEDVDFCVKLTEKNVPIYVLTKDEIIHNPNV
ncbi:Putative nucleotide-diphospho-sugar transferase [Orpheovirus IHUMI-LCC2]|uniref:Nucleotide-diphospho-sugar transferase n=1 Tax=Orpheovirus IHUMI-LCC2 TaxID=2023057 RepID=A0A2I2L6F6_9VIRU|nr:Putative nucleotide-diphospho-sugar transferase [Orpheovirus IHUMI-LCC2]SNW63080.1 Putative nucleotide-diphospho-sugar transferase [Orpheovirus IHUMI-LCC2]